MKKLITFVIAAFAFATTLSLSSCSSKSNQEVLEEFEKKTQAAEDAMRSGDFEKGAKLSKEAMEYAQDHAEQIQAATLELQQDK